MKKIFTLLLVTGSIPALYAQKASTTNVPAKQTTETLTTSPVAVVLPENLLTLKETEFDFGKIPQGKPVTHIFDVTNNSKENLRIISVNASCGCTTPEWEKDKIVAPGEQTKITVGYNAAAEGPFTKFITVSYNDTQSKQIIIKGEVWKTPGSSAPENKALNDLKN